MFTFQYYKGRPRKIWQYRLLIFLNPLVYIYLSLTALMLWCIRENLIWLRAEIALKPILLIVLNLLVVAFLTRLLWSAAKCLSNGGRIVPYFEKSNKGKISRDTFTAGAAVAAHCEALDLLASQRGLVPLSHFGFKDDRLWQKVKWHDPEQGLHSVDGLITALEEERPFHLEEERAEIISELKKWQSALEQARVLAVPFCLVIRLSDKWISPMEMDERVGTFW